ncbi:hypothetical protein SAMN05660284_01755 [Formivibrio citricus]|uniref:Uncharacterized protein n=1 Tax=Formivibrio citricus TaxID=83765 RepID=A0A1I4ZX56_9NEIS|nr:hypothetical protein [Formivibrio citricus]SFN54787.1 hypothetical protein SAMN05660284_01755 [Formivibrio citricus]
MGKFLAPTVCLCLYSAVSLGACDDSFVAKVRRNFGYADGRNEWSEFVACKQYPPFEGKSIVAIAKRQAGTAIGDSETMGDYNLDIALVDNRTATVLKHAFFKRRFLSDGYRFDGIEIDTANYAVAPNLRAFGIRANFHIDLGFTSSQTLSLVIPSGKTFREVLSNADMNIIFTRNWPSCRNETREATRTLAISNQVTHGYFDLIVRETLVDTRERGDVKKTDECVSSVEHKETKTYILRFNGRHYVVPVNMREFDCRIC